MTEILSETTHRSIALPNKIEGSEDFGKKIDLDKLFLLLEKHPYFRPNNSPDSSPTKSYLTIRTPDFGSLNVYRNGSCTAALSLGKEESVALLDFLYKVYVRDVLYEEDNES